MGVGQFGPEPGAAVGPETIGSGPRHAEQLAGFLQRKTAVIMELYKVSREWILHRQGVEGFVNGDDF